MTTDPDNKTSSNAADTGRSVHLSASAGSGKTRALKERYLALLAVLDDRGLGIDQAVAITFTEKAAAEIKERVMRDLPEPMLKKIIRGRQDLRISTIHSFCMNLLKRYPLEAGLPPDFGVVDSRDQAAKIQKAIEDTLEGSDRDQELMAPLKNFTVTGLISTIEFLISIRSRLKRMEIDAGGPDGLLRSIRAGMEIDSAEAELNALINSAGWRASFQEMECLLKAAGDNYYDCMGPEHLLLSDAKHAGRAFSTASALAPVYFTVEGKARAKAKIPKKSFKSKKRPEYEQLFFALQALLYRLTDLHQRARGGRESLSMLRLYLRAVERYQASKLREGLLDFDDLEIYAYRLLQNTESSDILYWLDRKILHFLVDEFQDTSDLQWAILEKLTNELFAGQGADKRMSPTLFVVGDEKQSIYRFREANYRLIENVKQKMETLLPPELREVLTLDRNFRSTPEVIITVNSVFAGLWGNAYAPSDVERKDHRGSVRLIELQPLSEEVVSSERTEAEVLAQSIRSFVKNGAFVYKKIDDRWNKQPAGYGDCAILIQSRTKLKEYETALQQAGVPYRVLGGIGFFEEDEIQAVMNTLFFLRNRDDTLALAAALRSALFGLTDGDLFDLMQQRGDVLDALRTLRPGAWERMHGWQQIAGVAPLASLIHTIINESGAYVRFGRRNHQAIFNLDKLLDTAREFDRRGYTTLQDFVEWVRNIRRTEQREATADMNLPGSEGFVSILTVHKAKGLEFSVVFLPGMNQAARSLTNGPKALISETDGGKRIAIKDTDNPMYDDLWKGDNGEQEELRREHQRLLYVAMTRARDHLIMLGTLGNNRTPIKQNTWLDYLHTTAPLPLFEAPREDPAGTRLYSFPVLSDKSLIAEKPPFSPLSRSGSEREISGRRDVQRVLDNIAVVPRSETLEWKNATDFVERAGSPAIGPPHTPFQARAVSPLTRGNMLHRCLEEFTKNGTYDLDTILGEHSEALLLGTDAMLNLRGDIKAVLDRVLNDAGLAWIFDRQANAYSELPFLLRKGQTIVSGVIDRVIIMENKGHIIDYKAILVENDEVLNAWTNHYRPQIQIYCDAAKDIFRVANVEGYLFFLDSCRLEPVSRVK